MTDLLQKGTLSGHPGNIRSIQALTCLNFFIPICIETILLIRIIAVYPPRLQTLTKNILIYGVLASMQLGRLINMALFFKTVIITMRTSANAFIGVKLPSARAEWFLQLMYDM